MAPPSTPAVCTDGRTRTTPEAVALLHQAQAGDIEAFAALYCAYRGLIGRYVYVRTQDRDAAADLVQDTFTDAHRPARRRRRRGRLAAAPGRPFLHQTRLGRPPSAPRRTRSARAALPQPGARPDTPRITLVAALIAGAKLTSGQRQAVQLRLAGHPRDTAATEMDRSREAVRCLERRAVLHLRTAAGVR